MAKKATLDDFDRSILRVVQRDNQLTNAEIGERIGLSTSSVRRRLARLREEGVVAADVTRLHPDEFGVTLIVTISFATETPEDYAAFDDHMRSLAPVKQSYHIAGDDDYMLIVHGPSPQWYEEWAKQTLMSNPIIRRYSTRVVWSCKKFDTALDV